jgi:hypothetical protein
MKGCPLVLMPVSRLMASYWNVVAGGAKTAERVLGFSLVMRPRAS